MVGNRVRTVLWVACTLTLLLGACGGGDDDDDDDDDDDVRDATSDTTTPTDGNMRDGAADGPSFDAGETFTNGVFLINEISGGDEWVELVNAGPVPFDASGFQLADRNKDTGEPKLDEAVTFPAGTEVAPGGYLMVRGGGIGEDAKPCPEPLGDAGVDAGDGGPGGERRCFNAEFGISNKVGESLFLIDAQGTVVGKVVYPAGAAQGAFTYSRLPDADPAAGFSTTLETPWAPNRAP